MNVMHARAVRGFVQGHPGCTTGDLADAWGCSYHTASYALRTACKEGIIVEGHPSGHFKTYRTGREIVEPHDAEDILGYIRSHQGCTVRELSHDFGIPVHRVDMYLAELEGQGMVRIEKGHSPMTSCVCRLLYAGVSE